MPRTIALVACVSRKRTSPSPARDLYVSDWFPKASAYAKQVADEWYILSGKDGLLAPGTTIAPFLRDSTECLPREKVVPGCSTVCGQQGCDRVGELGAEH
jgi:hypothetical protein